jgi:polyferredoxin
MPDQTVLVHLAGGWFVFGPVETWPREFRALAALLVTAGFGLFLLAEHRVRGRPQRAAAPV